MERSSLHIAVLVVAEDPATVDLASATFLADKLNGAGHRVVAQEVVEYQEAAIRDQLARWVGQGHIDVIVAAGAGDVASAALGPLVTRPIAGLTDQLRLLARDRGSADKPVAARASSKFVFLLPPEIGALGATLNQLVLPQLDSTLARNLVGEMPRFRPAEAVPQTIAAEKTVTGAGVAPKLPASAREKRKTGANVIARREAGLEDPTKQTRLEDPTKPTRLEDPTKPIGVEPQGKRPRSAPGAHDAPTRPNIDLASMLPSVPPGADDVDAHDEMPGLLEGPTSVTVQPARARQAVGTAKPAPGSNDVTKIAPAPTAPSRISVPAVVPRIATPSAGGAKIPGSGDATKVAPSPAEPVTPLPSLKPRTFADTIKPATKPLPSMKQADAAADEPKAADAAKEPARAAALRLPAPTPVSGTTTASAAAKTAAPVESAGPKSVSAVATVEGAARAAARGRTTQPSPAPPIARPPVDAARPPIDVVRPAELEAAAAEEAVDAASSADLIEAAAADFEEVSTPARPPATPPRAASGSAPPPRPAAGPAPVVPTRPATGPAPVAPPRPATGPAPVVPTRPATGPAPVAPTRPATGPAPVVPSNGANGVAARPPTGPVPVPARPLTGPAGIVPAVATSAAQLPPLAQPELLDLREGTQKKRRSRTGTALVRPSRAPILMYLALAAAAVGGFFAVIHFLPRFTQKDDRAAQAAPSQTPPAPPPAPPPVGSATGSAESAGSASAPAGSAQAQVAEAGSAEQDIALEPPPAHDTVQAPAHDTHAVAPPSHAPPSHAPPSHAAVAHAAPAHAPTGAGGAVPAPAQGKPEVAKPAEPAAPEEDGCDEVSCVMEKYARACCARYKPNDEAFHPKGAVPDALDKSMVKAGIEKVKPKVVACGEKIAAKGTVKLAITVAPEGNISEISVSEAPDAALGECVLAAVKRATFGKSTNGASFTYPFAF